MKKLETIVSLGHSAIYAKIKAKKFPPGRKDGGARYWLLEAEVMPYVRGEWKPAAEQTVGKDELPSPLSVGDFDEDLEQTPEAAPVLGKIEIPTVERSVHADRARAEFLERFLRDRACSTIPCSLGFAMEMLGLRASEPSHFEALETMLTQISQDSFDDEDFLLGLMVTTSLTDELAPTEGQRVLAASLGRDVSSQAALRAEIAKVIRACWRPPFGLSAGYSGKWEWRSAQPDRFWCPPVNGYVLRDQYLPRFVPLTLF